MAEEDEDRITKIVVIDSESVLPSDAAMQIYASETAITIKETCFGTMVTGPEDAVNRVVEEVRSLDHNHIFVKERGFAPGDERRCRASRGGGPRPGFHYLRQEVQTLPLIGRALEDYEIGRVPEPSAVREKLPVSKLKEIAESRS
jgi:putative methanogenesis marker protein 6